MTWRSTTFLAQPRLTSPTETDLTSLRIAVRRRYEVGSQGATREFVDDAADFRFGGRRGFRRRGFALLGGFLNGFGGFRSFSRITDPRIAAA